MPISEETLEDVARDYVELMTSIRGRRVRRLIVREFANFDHVIPTTTEENAPVLIALRADGRFAVCGTDGRGPTVEVSASRSIEEAMVTTSYDLAKDSLPIVSWRISHSSLAQKFGTLTIFAADLTPTDRNDVARVLRTSTE
jgi:hypothetical protein